MHALSVVTGASGHIGYALLRQLLDSGERVRILIRKDAPMFDGLDCERVYGDVTDPDSLEEAFRGADVVYHLAGIIDINTGHDAAVWNVNFGGTKNVVEACRTCAVSRLVYASSVDAFLPLPGNALMRETDSFDPDVLEGTYAKTKAAATQYVFDACRSGLDAVVVYPGACIGPYDYKVSNIGEMVRMYMHGGVPVSLSFGAYNFVDVRDVANGMILAAERGKTGEGYILCGEQISADGFIRAVFEAVGKKPPRIRMGKGIVSLAAPIMEVYYNLSKTTPLFTRYSIRKIQANSNFSTEKAEKELGYTYRSVQQSVRDMVAWIRENENH